MRLRSCEFNINDAYAKQITRTCRYADVFLCPRDSDAVERTRHNRRGNSNIIYKRYGSAAILQKEHSPRLQFYQN